MEITLGGLLEALAKSKNLTANVYQNDKLLISFKVEGYDALDDFLLEEQVERIKISSINNIYVYLEAKEDDKDKGQDGDDPVDDDF